MSSRLKPLEAEIARLEGLLKEGVRTAGKTFFYKGIRVTFARGRVTFDNKALQEYSVANPDIIRFRKVGQPIVSLRYVAADDRPPPDEPAGDE